MRIAIVGGSLAGLTAALLLRDAGNEVVVHERRAAPLTGFGTGIVVQPELARYLVERTGADLADFSVPSKAMRYFDARTGILQGEVDADWKFTSYDALYRRLHAAFGPEQYRLGSTLVGLSETPQAIELRFASGEAASYDLAIGADGGQSTVRSRLTGVSARYAGYISWRGVVVQPKVSPETWRHFDGVFTYGLLEDSHVIAYPVPVLDDERIADRMINFQWYWNVDEGADLDELLTGTDGQRKSPSVQFELLQGRYLQELKARAGDQLSQPFAELVTSAERPFVTVIADSDVPGMVFGRTCLIGDAAITPRPHAAAGAAKAALDAWSLSQAVAGLDESFSSLARWEEEQLALGRAYLLKVRRMGAVLQHGGQFLPGDPANRFGLPSKLDYL